MSQDDVGALRKLTQEMLDRYADTEVVVRMAKEPLYTALVALNQRVAQIEDAFAATQEPPLTFDRLCEEHSTVPETQPA
jgi:hypothetical protein